MSFATLDKRIGDLLKAHSDEIVARILQPGAMKTMDAYMAAICEHAAYVNAREIVHNEIERIARGEGDPEQPKDGENA